MISIIYYPRFLLELLVSFSCVLYFMFDQLIRYSTHHPLTTSKTKRENKKKKQDNLALALVSFRNKNQQTKRYIGNPPQLINSSRILYPAATHTINLKRMFQRIKKPIAIGQCPNQTEPTSHQIIPYSR